MSNSDLENLPTAMSDSDHSEEIQSKRARTPMSVSSSDDEPPSKRARTHIIQEFLQQAAVTGPTQENPTDIATPSQLTPPLLSFVCSFKQAKHLKFAIEGLSDPVHNTLGSGRIDVDVNGFHVTVQNKITNVISHLFLKPSEFEFNKPIEGKTVINLPALYMCKELTDVQDYGPLDIYSVEGSDVLNFFTIGTVSTTEFSVKLLENNDEIPKFPELSPISYTHVPPMFVRVMVEHLLGQVPHEVFVEITANTARLMVGQKKFEPLMVKVAGSPGVEPGKSYRASFQWSNAQWLNKAKDMGTMLEVSLRTTERCTYIVLSFIIKDVLYLEYMKEPIP